MVLRQRSVTLALNLLNGERNGLATGLMFGTAVTVVAKQKSDALQETMIADTVRKF